MNLFLATSFVLILLGLLAYTIWYRMHKRKLRKCKCLLEGGEVCGCDPERIGKIYSIVQPPGTHPSIDGQKVLAIVFTRCRSTGAVGLAKYEEKYVRRTSRWWKLLVEPAAYESEFSLLLSVPDAITVAYLLEKIVLPNGKSGTTVLDGVVVDPEHPEATPVILRSLLEVIERHRRRRDGKTRTRSLTPVHSLKVVPATR